MKISPAPLPRRHAAIRTLLRVAEWLDDYALFIALKQQHGVEHVWTEWEPEVVTRHAAALNLWRRQLAKQNEREKFWAMAIRPSMAYPSRFLPGTEYPHHGRSARST